MREAGASSTASVRWALHFEPTIHCCGHSRRHTRAHGRTAMAAAIGAMLADLQPARRKDKRKGPGAMTANVNGGRLTRKQGASARPRRKQRDFASASKLDAGFDIDAASPAEPPQAAGGVSGSAQAAAKNPQPAGTLGGTRTGTGKPLSNAEEALREVAVLRSGPMLAVEVLRRLR